MAGTADSETTRTDAESSSESQEKYLSLKFELESLRRISYKKINNDGIPSQTVVEKWRKTTTIRSTNYISIATYFATYNVLQRYNTLTFGHIRVKNIVDKEINLSISHWIWVQRVWVIYK